MNLLKKMVGMIIILSLFGIHFPRTCLAWRNNSSAKTAKATTITKHTPEFLAPPEVKIPFETPQKKIAVEKGKTNKWLWIGAGVVAAGAIAALSGGGDGGGVETGSIVITGPAP